jgi:hypothetical protein
MWGGGFEFALEEAGITYSDTFGNSGSASMVEDIIKSDWSITYGGYMFLEDMLSAATRPGVSEFTHITSALFDAENNATWDEDSGYGGYGGYSPLNEGNCDVGWAAHLSVPLGSCANVSRAYDHYSKQNERFSEMGIDGDVVYKGYNINPNSGEIYACWSSSLDKCSEGLDYMYDSEDGYLQMGDTMGETEVICWEVGHWTNSGKCTGLNAYYYDYDLPISETMMLFMHSGPEMWYDYGGYGGYGGYGDEFDRRTQDDMSAIVLEFGTEISLSQLVAHAYLKDPTPDAMSAVEIQLQGVGVEGGLGFDGTIEYIDPRMTMEWPVGGTGVFAGENIFCIDAIWGEEENPVMADIVMLDKRIVVNLMETVSGMSTYGAIFFVEGYPALPEHVFDLPQAIADYGANAGIAYFHAMCDGRPPSFGEGFMPVTMGGFSFTPPIDATGQMITIDEAEHRALCDGTRPTYPPLEQPILPTYISQVAEILFPLCAGPECEEEEPAEDTTTVEPAEDTTTVVVQKTVAKVEATLEIDLSAVELEVDLTDPSELEDLSAISEEAKAEVTEFANDVADGYADAVADSLGVDTESVTVSCLYLKADAAATDLLTLDGTSCNDKRRLAGRRLQSDDGFGILVEMVDDAQQAVAAMMEDDDSGSSFADTLETMEVVVESDLIVGGSLQATVAEVAAPETVTMEVEVEVPVTTPEPTPSPTNSVESSALVQGLFAALALAIFG